MPVRPLAAACMLRRVALRGCLPRTDLIPLRRLRTSQPARLMDNPATIRDTDKATGRLPGSYLPVITMASLPAAETSMSATAAWAFRSLPIHTAMQAVAPTFTEIKQTTPTCKPTRRKVRIQMPRTVSSRDRMPAKGPEILTSRDMGRVAIQAAMVRRGMVSGRPTLVETQDPVMQSRPM